MFYRTDYNSPIGIITLGADEDNIVGLWMKGQKYFGDTVKGEMYPKDDLAVFKKQKTGWTGIFKVKNRQYPNYHWLRLAENFGKWYGKFFVKYLMVKSLLMEILQKR